MSKLPQMYVTYLTSVRQGYLLQGRQRERAFCSNGGRAPKGLNADAEHRPNLILKEDGNNWIVNTFCLHQRNECDVDGSQAETDVRSRGLRPRGKYKIQ